MANDIKDFPLGITGFHFSDLYKPERLKDLHAEFWKQTSAQNPNLQAQLTGLRSSPLKPQEESEILIQVAKHVGDFVARLFQVSNYAARLKQTAQDLHPIFRFKKEFLHFRCAKRFDTEAPVDDAAFKALDEKVKKILAAEAPISGIDEENMVARSVNFLLDCEKKLKTAPALEPVDNPRAQTLLTSFSGSLTEKVTGALKIFEDWCVQAYVSPTRRATYLNGWVSIIRPHKLDFANLVETEKPDAAVPEKLVGPEKHLRFRDGFKLTDNRMNRKEVAREIDYCIYCHERDKDSCSKGFPEKTEGYKKNPLGIPLKGCPLDERISEMHVLERDGETIAALAMIMLDNPMCPGTGHRICNDCMKGCIFQKQDPVNIPQNETGVLTEVLNLPYGFEIYSLLTRFNPLNTERPYALPYNGKDVLVVGLGPAGYTLAHYLANDGFGVVGIDGLKLEPIDKQLSGIGQAFPKPIQNFSELKKELDERVLMGFGGVSEYGITVRWDKNFLAVIYLTLLRRQNLRVYGGVRFGGTITVQDAWKMGFSHIALATGAGKPTVINMKNNLIKGIRKASDFLMALQLTGAFKKTSMANLQVKLPAVVIGGGLTAIDTATEMLAYYPIQVEKALERFETLSREFGEEKTWAMCDEEEKETLKTFIEHGRQIREERKVAERERRNPDFIGLCRKWGGVSLVYRKKMSDSPAYRLNHEEIIKAFEEGISFVESLSPTEAVKDKYGAVEALIFERENKEKVTLPAKTVCVAAGTSPNTIYEREFPGTFALDDKKNFFKKHVAEQSADGKWTVRPSKGTEAGGFFLSHQDDGKLVSYYGDNHPDYAGNVVKAMASAKHGAPHVRKLFAADIKAAEQKGADPSKFQKLTSWLDDALVPKVVRVDRLTPTIVEVIVKGHFVSNKFEPGQFYRLQNYETLSPVVDGNKLQMEGLALTGAWVEKDKDLLSLIVLEMGGSSRLCSALRPGEPVVVMGPTGTPSEIPENKTIALVGGGLGNAVLLSIAHAMKAKGNKIIYFAGYKNPEDVFKQDQIEAGTDVVVWACDKQPGVKGRRPGDINFVGNIVQAMEAYGSGKLGKQVVPLSDVDHMIVIGSDRMMAAVGAARHGVLKPYLKTDHMAIGSINSPMQCMMKEVCAQCLQKHVDPKTGKEEFIFSCFNQDQPLDCVDFTHLNQRLKMNSLPEKLVNRQLDYLFQKANLERR